MKNEIKLSIVSPGYNEEGNLLPLAKSMGPLLDHFIGKNTWEFIFVDNGSKDKTRQEIEFIRTFYPLTQYIYLKDPNIGNALFAGLNAVRAPWGHVINSDWWDELFIVWAWNIRDQYDLFVASKMLDTMLDKRPKGRKFLSCSFNFVLRFLTGFQGTETHGPKLLNMQKMRPILDKCTIRRGQFDTEFTISAYRCGLRIAEFPIGAKEIRHRRNPMIKKILQNLYDVCRLSIKIKQLPDKGPSKFKQYKRKDAKEYEKLINQYMTIW